MFKICARTVLELGAELISSDVIAFYELIKNAFDARSRSGAQINFEITIRRNEYLKLRLRSQQQGSDVNQLKAALEDALERSAPPDSLNRIKSEIQEVKDIDSFLKTLDRIYASDNLIIVSDEGSGMSKDDLINNYLVIGTASRKRAINEALTQNIGSNRGAPYLGEKGIGRLSVMRLGDRLRVETAISTDKSLNVLEIDWSLFDNLDAMLDEIDIEPRTGAAKPALDWSGTRLIIGSLSADWTQDRVRKSLGEHEFARLTDPFGDAKRRPRIAVFWNGTRIPIAHMDQHLLEHAHASVRGKFDYDKSGPYLECKLEAIDLGFEHPREFQIRKYYLPDLQGAISGLSQEIPISALESLGSFDFDIYWYNRQRLGGIDSIGDRETVRKLHQRWSGILLFRDGFRVLPYGEDSDDWLGLDRRALGSSGYLLNKAQFIGRVRISRLGNPHLIDQTNREGLRVCPEQQAFISLLQLVIQTSLRDFLRDFESRYKNQPLVIKDAKTEVATLETRAKAALKKIKRMAPTSSEEIDELQQTFFEIKEFFDMAQKRISEIESENQQMVHMAGVGLLVEVVAHELARSTENALSALEALRGQQVPEQISGLLNSLRAEMKAVAKRVRVLDPLSVSGRQHKEVFDLKALLEDTLSGHELQFERHKIKVNFTGIDKTLRIRAVKGMIIQIFENLLSNSLYWLDLRKQREPDLKPQIEITVNINPLTITFEDNGPGIAPENRENIFRAFFSLKEKTKRRGLGLYIARECAQYHGGSLILDENTNPQTGRLNRFILILPREVVVG